MPYCIIIDPCLFRFGGHEYSMNEFLSEEAKRSEYTPLVLCNHQFQEKASFPYKAIFTYSPYASTGSSPKEDKAMFQFGNRDVFAMLKRHISIDQIPSGSMILLHSACATILGGIARWLKIHNRSDIKLRIVMRWSVKDRYSSLAIGIKLHQHVFDQIDQLSCDVRYYVDSRCLRAHYQELFQKDCSITPIGVDFSHAPTAIEPPKSAEHLRFVFSGTPMMSKGGPLIPQAVHLHLGNFPHDHFIIHICGLDTEEEKIFTALPQSNVTLIRAYKKGSDYFGHLLLGDVALLPYSPQAYKLRTSHILLESLGVGRGVIVSPHPWMNQIINELPKKCGVSMKEWNAESLAESMAQFHEQKKDYLAAAYQQLGQIQNTHNAREWWKSVQ